MTYEEDLRVGFIGVWAAEELDFKLWYDAVETLTLELERCEMRYVLLFFGIWGIITGSLMILGGVK